MENNVITFIDWVDKQWNMRGNKLCLTHSFLDKNGEIEFKCIKRLWGDKSIQI